MGIRNEITFEDDLWENGMSYDDKTGELMSPYMRLKKIMGNNKPTIFDNESYGKGSQKPTNEYFEAIEKYSYVNKLKERWKKEDWC